MNENKAMELTIELTTERMSYGPAAIGRHNGKVYFVHGAAPQETVLVKVISEKKNYAEAEVLKIIKPSVDRVQPKCSVFGFGTKNCGGCDWQHLNAEAQLREKNDIVIHEVYKATKIPKTELKKITTAYPSQKSYEYRTRTQFQIGTYKNNHHRPGFFARNSHELIQPDICEILHPTLKEKWKLNKSKEYKNINKIEWKLNSSGQFLESNDPKENPLGFSQINFEQNEVLKRTVERHANETTTKTLLLDLYAGDGNLTEYLKNSFEEIISVESIEPLQKPNYGEYFVKNVDRFLQNFHKVPNVIIADPPRSGLQAVAKQIAKLHAEKIILVFCDPTVISRDLEPFLKNAKITSIEVLDMFPQTHHVESVLVLKSF